MSFDNKWIAKDFDGKYRIVKQIDESDLKSLNSQIKGDRLENFAQGQRVILKQSLFHKDKATLIVVNSDKSPKDPGMSVVYDVGNIKFQNAKDSVVGLDKQVATYRSEKQKNTGIKDDMLPLTVEDGNAIIPYWGYFTIAGLAFFVLAIFIFVPKSKKNNKIKPKEKNVDRPFDPYAPV